MHIIPTAVLARVCGIRRRLLHSVATPKSCGWGCSGRCSGLCRAGRAQTLIEGELGRPFPVARGIRQRCPASGSAWAILNDRRIRLSQASRASSVVPGIFADDIGPACNEVVSVARAIGALSTRVTTGTSLRLQSAQTQVLLGSRRAWEAWAVAAADPDFVLAPAGTLRCARNLLLQLAVHEEEPDVSLQFRRVEAWIRWIAGLPSGMCLRLDRHSRYALSVLRHRRAQSEGGVPGFVQLLWIPGRSKYSRSQSWGASACSLPSAHTHTQR